MLLYSSPEDVEDNCSSNKRFEYILARTDTYNYYSHLICLIKSSWWIIKCCTRVHDFDYVSGFSRGN